MVIPLFHLDNESHNKAFSLLKCVSSKSSKTKLKLSVLLELWHSIEKLITRELNNNYTLDLESHKISVICASDDGKRENIQKAGPHFAKTASERLDPQKLERKLWQAQEVFERRRISASWCFRSHRLRLKNEYKRGLFFLTTARWITSPTWGSPPSCKQALENKCK